MKKTNGKIHYKKIQIKQIIKKENTKNPNININNHHPKKRANFKFKYGISKHKSNK